MRSRGRTLFRGNRFGMLLGDFSAGMKAFPGFPRWNATFCGLKCSDRYSVPEHAAGVRFASLRKKAYLYRKSRRRRAAGSSPSAACCLRGGYCLRRDERNPIYSLNSTVYETFYPMGSDARGRGAGRVLGRLRRHGASHGVERSAGSRRETRNAADEAQRRNHNDRCAGQEIGEQCLGGEGRAGHGRQKLHDLLFGRHESGDCQRRGRRRGQGCSGDRREGGGRRLLLGADDRRKDDDPRSRRAETARDGRSYPPPAVGRRRGLLGGEL